MKSLFLAFLLESALSPAADVLRPNIIFVLFDDLGYGQPKCYREGSEFIGKSGKGEYGDWIYQGDHMLGQVLEALDRRQTRPLYPWLSLPEAN